LPITSLIINSLKCCSNTEVKYERILIALRVAVRIKCKIKPRRPDRQKILQAEPDGGTKALKKIIEGIGNDIGAAVIGFFTLLFP